MDNLIENKQILELITKKIPSENVFINESMKKHTTFKIGGDAEIFIKAKNIEEIKYILDISNTNNIPLTIIGNGSNLLVKDNGVKGIVLKIDIDNIEIENIKEESEIKKFNIDYELMNIDKEKINEYAIVTVTAGVPVAKLAQILLKHSISGFEFASGIPGTIGGAVRMNAGAYGLEFKDIVIETTCIDRNGTIFKLNNKEQKFDYRTSIFKFENYIILETKLLLKYVQDKEEISNKMDEYKKSRMEKQPLEYPNAGSTFKRGADFITAKLIDESGLKNLQVGGAKVSDKHAGFVINTGNATAKDVLDLVEIIKSKVYNKFQKKIELEIEVIGK